ncbi:MAG: hypothetical protein HY785_23335 [Oscillatoriophycideae cyanobacterium NC_groundwater_1537_Pr4_S-0.65um_50_18]|nr:hypothetical protein [Oscillatoriophycideae cyanobacterium NC_groundwater_1537_Pr4_S-0.65um_50_18]
MIQKVAFGSICTGLALSISLWSNDKVVQATAVAAGSCFASFTVTTIAIEQNRLRKSRVAHADLYLDLLRQMSRPSPAARPARPTVCQGCRFYHGQTYNGNHLICGMHPYGVDDDYCADWESHTEQS